MSLTRSVTVSARESGTDLCSFLAARFTYQSAEQWRAHAEGGRISLNGTACPGTEALRSGDVVSFAPEPHDEPPVNREYSVLHEDDDFLFIDKPPLLPCHPGGIYLRNTLWSLLSERWGTVHLVNRLDRETSGIVIAAKTPEAASWAGRAMAAREVEKAYLVAVEGDFPERAEARGFLERDELSPVRKKLRFAREDGGNGIACHTIFAFKEGLPLGRSLVEAIPLTGRTHQIRATLESLGFPVVGDKLYGRDPTIFLRFISGSMTERDRDALGQSHQALHCARIAMPNMRGGRYVIEAGPMPGGHCSGNAG